jgi:hypothetical protein
MVRLITHLALALAIGAQNEERGSVSRELQKMDGGESNAVESKQGQRLAFVAPVRVHPFRP